MTQTHNFNLFDLHCKAEKVPNYSVKKMYSKCITLQLNKFKILPLVKQVNFFSMLHVSEITKKKPIQSFTLFLYVGIVLTSGQTDWGSVGT